ncbi:MAG: TIGR02221 family CRISPR-associated protein [Methanotrichaceae archaeon]|nr:TIGR02221 family CRISPR-associated protein [Methanotrichaceae archaeon]
MRKALSFLGTGNYQETTYFLGNKECRTKLFPEAVHELFRPDEMVVLLTEAAGSKYLDNLKSALAGKSWRYARIPDGKNEAEIWDIFEVITQSVGEGDELIFDITHAFRSIPMLTMISVAYLRSARNITLEAVVYGAWDAREGDRSPVFDLTPFMKLLDWTNAAEMFIRTGHGGDIARLLRSAQDIAYRRDGSDGQDPPRELKNIAKDIDSISRALALARPKEVIESAQRLRSRPETYRSEAQEWAKPFFLLVNKIADSFIPFAESDKTDIPGRLETEYRIIEWLLERDQVIQAILLSREWIVTYAIHRLGKGKAYDRAFREQTEERINNAAKGEEGLPVENEILSIWRRLGDLRNDIAHCGMREEPMSSENLIKNARRIHKELRKFTDAWDE